MHSKELVAESKPSTSGSHYCIAFILYVFKLHVSFYSNFCIMIYNMHVLSMDRKYIILLHTILSIIALINILLLLLSIIISYYYIILC